MNRSIRFEGSRVTLRDSGPRGRGRSATARGRAEAAVAARLGVAALLALSGGAASAQPVVDPSAIRAAAAASDLASLAHVPIPEVDLRPFLNPGPAARQAALRLGKALFWDMQAGSDGQACASCHFHAGADSRARNQLSPGLEAVPRPSTLFGDNDLGVPGYPQFQPDYTLLPANFPLHLLADPEQNDFGARVVLRDTNDVVSSMGAFPAIFAGVTPGVALDAGTPYVDPVFNRNTPSATDAGRNVRRVEPRNTPTTIGALFNHSNFWDGRAHNLFNGVSPIGPLDPGALIWVAGPGGTLSQEEVRVANSSLASQAVGPPLSDFEMSFSGRPFPLVARKLLGAVPLGRQLVDPGDSVLGPYSNYPATGVRETYAALIRAAFKPRYWSSTEKVPGTDFSLMEANFTLFWGLAIQLYEFTLVPDRTPFDRFMEGEDGALSPAQLQGLLVFLNRGARGNLPEVDLAIAGFERANPGLAVGAGNCVSCHGSASFTDAAFASLSEGPKLELIEIEDTTRLLGGRLALDPTQGLLDNGFSNIGVRPTSEDLGRGGMKGGFPLAFSRQLVDHPELLTGVVTAPLPCKVGTDCPTRLLVDGAFKIPGLRNVELTGPYFHNGGQATLGQVIEFYDRQSDFADVNVANVDRNMVFIELGESDEGPLVQLLLGLTDPRVRDERGPFDHPQLFVPSGGTASHPQVLTIPQVGAGGRPAAGLPPLGTFLGLPQD